MRTLSCRLTSSLAPSNSLGRETCQGGIDLKNASGCELVITGGTECAHELKNESCRGYHNPAIKSHWNGYKLDFRITDCLNAYIQRNMTPAGNQYKSKAGNIYVREANPPHWDVTYVTP